VEITVLRPQPVPDDAVEVRVPLRDGVELAADLYAAGEEPRPVVLVRLPYDKDGAYCFLPSIARYFVQHGYTAVIQDVRGKFRSGGATEFGVHEVDDGYDTVAWVAAQPWCDGRVLMWGDSYFGMTQLAAAASGHPALTAISPRVTGTRLGRDVTFADGSRDVEVTSRKGYFSSWYVDRDAYEWEIDWVVVEDQGPRIDELAFARMQPEDVALVRETLGEPLPFDEDDVEPVELEDDGIDEEVARLEDEIADSRRRQLAFERYLEALDALGSPLAERGE
jgi:hypothetical protein